MTADDCAACGGPCQTPYCEACGDEHSPGDCHDEGQPDMPPMVGQGDECVVLLRDPGVMTPAQADALALALMRGADNARRVGRCMVCATTQHTSATHLATLSHTDLMNILLAEQRSAVAQHFQAAVESIPAEKDHPYGPVPPSECELACQDADRHVTGCPTLPTPCADPDCPASGTHIHAESGRVLWRCSWHPDEFHNICSEACN